jgi:hypothetical protein
MITCITCGDELHPERAKKYNYCTVTKVAGLPSPGRAPDIGAGQRREGRDRGLGTVSGAARLFSLHWLPE